MGRRRRGMSEETRRQGRKARWLTTRMTCPGAKCPRCVRGDRRTRAEGSRTATAKTESTESVNEPAKVLRIGSMVKTLLDEVRAAPLDEKSRVRLREIYEQSIHDLSEGLSPDLVAELERMALPFDVDAPSDVRAAHRPGPTGGMARRAVPRDPGHPDVAADGRPGPARGDAPARDCPRRVSSRTHRARTCEGRGEPRADERDGADVARRARRRRSVRQRRSGQVRRRSRRMRHRRVTPPTPSLVRRYPSTSDAAPPAMGPPTSPGGRLPAPARSETAGRPLCHVGHPCRRLPDRRRDLPRGARALLAAVPAQPRARRAPHGPEGDEAAEHLRRRLPGLRAPSGSSTGRSLIGGPAGPDGWHDGRRGRGPCGTRTRAASSATAGRSGGRWSRGCSGWSISSSSSSGWSGSSTCCFPCGTRSARPCTTRWSDRSSSGPAQRDSVGSPGGNHTGVSLTWRKEGRCRSGRLRICTPTPSSRCSTVPPGSATWSRPRSADGQPALGITDHGNMYGVLDFYKACREQGIKPIIGTEAYMAAESRHERPGAPGTVDDTGGDAEGGQKLYYHLTLLAETDEGYRNLMQAVLGRLPRGLLLQAAGRLGAARAPPRRADRDHRVPGRRGPPGAAGRRRRRRPSSWPPGSRTSSGGRTSSSSCRTTASPTSTGPTRS